MIPAEDDRDDAAPGHLVHPLSDVGVTGRRVTVRAVGVADVDDPQLLEDLDIEIEVVRAGLVGRGPDRPRTEAGAGPVRGGEIEGCADDRHIGPPAVEIVEIGDEGLLTERRQPSEDVPELELRAHAGGEHLVGPLGHTGRVPGRVAPPVRGGVGVDEPASTGLTFVR